MTRLTDDLTRCEPRPAVLIRLLVGRKLSQAKVSGDPQYTYKLGSSEPGESGDNQYGS